MGTLYTLTDRERDTLSNQDQSDIIATGPWRKGYGSLAHRAVIRDHGDKLVVHTQIMGDSSAYFEHGVYVHDKDETARLEKALAAFDRKVRLQHNVPTYTGE